MYSLIAQLMQQQEAADSEPDESHEEVVSVRSARSDATAEMFYDTKSLDMDQRHRHQPSILNPIEQQCNEVAWTEFERQSSNQTESGSGSHEDVDDDSSLKEFMCKHYGALSTRVPSAAKGRLEL